MRYFLDALVCGPAAVGEYFVNGFYCALADVFCAAEDIKTKVNKKEKEVVETVEEKTEEITKAEIIEFKAAKESVNSILNAEFATADEDDLVDGKFTDDQVANFVEDITNKVIEASELNLDSEKDLKDIKLTTIALLLAINKMKFTASISEEFVQNRDDLVEINTIYKFFTNTRFFVKESSIQLNEVITTQLLYEVVTAIYNSEDFSKDEVFTMILNKVRKRLEKEAVSTAVLTDSEVDVVTPVMFNQGILNNAFDGRTPKMAKTSQEYIVNYISSILPQDWIRDNSVTFELAPKQDIAEPNKDTGMAVLTVMIFGQIMKVFDVDLDTITGNGYGLGIEAYWPNNPQPVTLFVSIEKFPEIIKNAIIRNYYTLNNPADPDSVNEFRSVIHTTYGPDIYNRFDLSGMSKHITFMTDEEKEQFGNNLMWISAANWPNLGLGQSQYRMRIRKYDSPDKFTLVSDKNTRQQLPDMLPVFGGQSKKFFKDPEDDVTDSNILVCKFDTDHIEVAVNGSTIQGITLPKKAEPIPMV